MNSFKINGQWDKICSCDGSVEVHNATDRVVGIKVSNQIPKSGDDGDIFLKELTFTASCQGVQYNYDSAKFQLSGNQKIYVKGVHK